MNCAPYLALRTLKQLVADEGGRFPAAADTLTHSTYVDDVLMGAPDVPSALQLRNKLRELLNAGGFPLRPPTNQVY